MPECAEIRSRLEFQFKINRQVLVDMIEAITSKEEDKREEEAYYRAATDRLRAQQVSA